MSPAGTAGRRLRVAVLNRVFSTTGGGAETYSIRLVEALSEQCEVHVFAQDIDHRWPGVTYHRVSCPMRKPRWINQLWYAWATWRATRKGFDVVHSHENTWHGQIQTVHVKPLRHNLLGGRKGLARALAWVRVISSPRLLTYVWLEGARFTKRPGRAVVVTSSLLRQDVLAAYPACAAVLHTVTPGVALQAAGLSRPEACAALNLPANRRVLLFVANDYARKGLQALLEAMPHIPGQPVLAVVGRADQATAFRREAERLGVGDQVRFLGPRSDMPAVYAAADLLVHPTLEDTYAMVVLEAMAHGLPVIVSGPPYCGIASDLTDEADALLLADPHDAARLAGTVARVFADAQLADRLSAQGRQFARAHGWQNAAAAYQALYRASVDQRD